MKACSLCNHGRPARRQLCWSCVRKVRRAGVTLPPAGCSVVDLVVAVVRAFTTTERQAVRAALEAA